MEICETPESRKNDVCSSMFKELDEGGLDGAERGRDERGWPAPLPSPSTRLSAGPKTSNRESLWDDILFSTFSVENIFIENCKFKGEYETLYAFDLIKSKTVTLQMFLRKNTQMILLF
jgi:hypothetical protein